MAADFDGVNDGLFCNDEGISTSLPYTVCAWVQPDNVANNVIFCASSSLVNGKMMGVGISTTGKAYARIKDSSDDSPQGTTELATDGTWYHVCGVFTEGEIRVYVDGTEEGSLTGTFGVPALLNRWTVAFRDSASFRSDWQDGRICEVAAWRGIGLADEHITALAKGISPALIMPDSLRTYGRLIRDFRDEVRNKLYEERLGAGGTTVAAHCPMHAYPHPRQDQQHHRSLIDVEDEDVQVVENVTDKGSLNEAVDETVQVVESADQAGFLHAPVGEDVQVGEEVDQYGALREEVAEDVQVVESADQAGFLNAPVDEDVQVVEVVQDQGSLNETVDEDVQIPETVDQLGSLNEAVDEDVQIPETVGQRGFLLTQLDETVSIEEALLDRGALTATVDEDVQVVEIIVDRGFLVEVVAEDVEVAETAVDHLETTAPPGTIQVCLKASVPHGSLACSVEHGGVAVSSPHGSLACVAEHGELSKSVPHGGISESVEVCK